jgi:hypothetical protein
MAKHRWQKLPDGEINTFADSCGFCNGPRCVECGFSFCEHCNPDGYNSECPGRAGFQIYIAKRNWHGHLLGVNWWMKKLFIGFLFFTVIFDFSGLFPYCSEVLGEEDL